ASQPTFTKKDLRYLSSMFLDSMYLNTGRKIDYLGLWPNNSFKPNLLRYTNNVADKACHVVGYATQVGLTPVLGVKSPAQFRELCGDRQRHRAIGVVESRLQGRKRA